MVEFGITLFIVAVLIIAIWVIIEVKRLRHKIFAIFLIALILFTYISFTVTLKSQDIDMTTIPGVTAASKLYVSWLASAFNNLKSITTQAIGLDWTPQNQSS
jgi:MFS superfamily sulfate permease-like transporter